MPATLDEFFAILSWSLAALQKGQWPEKNHLGQRYSPDSNEGKLAGRWVLRDSLVPCGRLRVYEFGSEAPSLCQHDQPLCFVSVLWW